MLLKLMHLGNFGGNSECSSALGPIANWSHCCTYYVLVYPSLVAGGAPWEATLVTM